MKILRTTLKYVVIAGMVLSACSTPVAVTSDAADCSNLAAGQTIKIVSAWSRTTASSGMSSMDSGMDATKNSAAYMVIHNCGTEADGLLSAASSVSEMTTLMTTEIKDGTASMHDVSRIDIPAGKKVELKPGSYHIMLMGLKNGLNADDQVGITLVFEKAGELTVVAPAKAP